MALDSLFATETDEYIRFKLDWVKKGIDVKVNPLELEQKIMKQYVGQYGVRRITLKKGVLYYKREGGSELKIILLGGDLFMVEGVEYFRIQFEKNKSGKVISLNGLYKDGTVSVSKRTK